MVKTLQFIQRTALLAVSFCAVWPSTGWQDFSQPLQSSNTLPSHFDQAEQLAKSQQYLQAISEYRLALRETPDDIAASFGLAIAQSQVGLDGEAIQSYLSILKLNPKLWEAEVNMGMLLLKQQKSQEALVHLQNAQRENPQNFRVHFYTAKSQEQLGDLSQAETAYIQALELAQNDSDRFDVHASFGSLYLKKKSWSEAEKQLLAAHQYKNESVAVDMDLA